MINAKLKIACVGFDWNNIAFDNINFTKSKLDRDGLNSNYNEFLLLYAGLKCKRQAIRKEPRFLTWHFYLLSKLRIFYDLFFIIFLPFVLIYEKFRPDIFYLCDFANVIPAIIPAKILKSKIYFRLCNLPTQLALTKGWVGKIYYLYYKIAEKLSYRFVDGFIAINETTKKYLIDLGVKEEKIILDIPDTIARDEEYIKSADEKMIRKKYNIEKDKKIIISIGSLIKEKGFDELIKIFAELKRNDLVLVICGKGAEEEKLKKLFFDLGVGKSVVFAGFVERKEIWSYLAGSDIFTLFSKSESLGMAFWEAMYFKIPVVGVNAGGMAETIGQDGERGFYWKKNLDDLRKKIDFCLKDSSEKKEMLNRARNYVINKLKLNKNINEIFNK